MLAEAPTGFASKPWAGRDLPGMRLTVQVAPDDCTGCGICVDVCPARSKELVRHKSINMEPAAIHRDAERPRWEFFERLPEIDRSLVRSDTVKGSQLLRPLFEFSGACSGCGETFRCEYGVPILYPGRPPSESEAAAEALRRVCGNDARRRRIVERAMKRLRRNERPATGLRRLLRNALSER